MRDSFGFLHVPKAAGTAVFDALSASLGTERFIAQRFDEILFGDFDRFNELPAHRQQIVLHGAVPRDANVVYGHFSYATLRTRFEPSSLATILREPRARAVSHYSFWRSWDEAHHASWDPHTISRAATADFGDFLTDPRIAYQTDNLMTRMLTAPDIRIQPKAFITPEDQRALAAAAIARLDDFGFVGLVERGGATWHDLGSFVGTELNARRSNETPEAGPPIDWDHVCTPRVMAALNARTAADALVWSHVAAGFDDLIDPPAAADAAFCRVLTQRSANAAIMRAQRDALGGIDAAAVDVLRTERDALQREVNAFRARKLIRWTDPVQRLYRRTRR